MNQFLYFVLSQLQSSLPLVLIAMAAAAVVISVCYAAFQKKHHGTRKFPWGKAVLALPLAGYLVILVYATVLRGFATYEGEKNLHLFRAWREAWNQFTLKTWANLLLNIALFVPLGLLPPLLWKKARKWHITIPVGAAISLGIELVQLYTGKGLFDVDDLLCNALGVAIGFLLVSTVMALFRQKGQRLKPALIYGLCTLLLLGPVLGVFPVYALQKYGNLPTAPSFTQRTADVGWVLQCQLPQTPERIATYQSQKRRKQDCDAFADAFAKHMNIQFDDIMYYDDAAYYHDHGSDGKYHFLHVDYNGTGYDFSWGYTDRDSVSPTWTAATRQELVAALAPYPFTVPPYAEFTVKEDGFHEFRVNQHLDGTTLTDGTLLCRYADDNTVREIVNRLGTYTYRETVKILSAQQAYRQLQDGKFQDDTFERVAPRQVQVLSCTLSYQVDTKGFYQPVYEFTICYGDNPYPHMVTIPAMN